jgi:hypothetical protein
MAGPFAGSRRKFSSVKAASEKEEINFAWGAAPVLSLFTLALG